MNIAGLTVVTISGVMLAFDPVFGPGNRFRIKNAQNKLNLLMNDRDKIISDWHNHPKWQDDRPYVEAEIKKVEDNYRPREAALRKNIDALGHRLERVAQNLTALREQVHIDSAAHGTNSSSFLFS